MLKQKDKSTQASALLFKMARVIWWYVPKLNKHKAHKLLKKITDHADILTRNKNNNTLINGNAISGSNFKLLF